MKVEDCPKAIEFTKPSGAVEKDHTNVQNFWIEKFNEVAARQKASPVAPNNFVAAAQGKPEDRKARDAEFMEDMNTPNQEDDGSNLPF